MPSVQVTVVGMKGGRMMCPASTKLRCRSPDLLACARRRMSAAAISAAGHIWYSGKK